MKKVLLDTNGYSRLLLGSTKILGLLSAAEVVYLSVIVLGELQTGFRGGSRYRENREQLENFLADPAVAVLDVTAETAEIFAELKHGLKKNGTPLPINEIWIAAQCIEAGALLITSDAHFQALPQVRVWNWNASA